MYCNWRRTQLTEQSPHGDLCCVLFEQDAELVVEGFIELLDQNSWSGTLRAERKRED
jgi:hypothetical protein